MQYDMFLKYCREKSKRLPLYKTPHDSLIYRIMRDPSVIKLKNILESYTQVPLLKNQEIIGEVDLVSFSSNDEVYICEAKTTLRCGRGAVSQLEKAYEYIKVHFGILPIRVSIRQSFGRKISRTIIMPEINDIIFYSRLNE